MEKGNQTKGNQCVRPPTSFTVDHLALRQECKRYVEQCMMNLTYMLLLALLTDHRDRKWKTSFT